MSKVNKAALLENIRQELQGRYPSALKSHYGTATLSLLAIGLTGCGGGGSTATTSTNTLGGSVIKGPLANALVFVDLDGDGRLDDNEVSATTNSDGSYSLSSSDAAQLEGTIVVQTNEDTVDSSSGEVLAGLTLSAPEGSEVVSPLTTLIDSIAGDQGDLSDEDYQAALETAETTIKTDLGISADVELTSFNPFETGVDIDDAKAVEKVAQQVTAIVNTIAKAVEAAGGDGEAAVSTALDAVADAIELSGQIDLTAGSTIGTILSEADTGSVIGSSEATSIESAISAVTEAIGTTLDVAENSLEDAREIFAVAQTVLSEASSSAVTGGDTTLLTQLQSATSVATIAQSYIKVEGNVAVSVEENDATDAGISATGALTIADDDETDDVVYQFEATQDATSVGSAFGTLQIDSEGNWTYTLDDETGLAAVNALQNPDKRGSIDSADLNVTENFSITEQFIVNVQKVVGDAAPVDAEYGTTGVSITKIITVNITGNNDAVTLTTDESAAATEDGAAVAIDLSDNFSDDDTADQLIFSEVVEGESATAGLTATSTGFSFDPTDAAYQGLSAGTPQVLTIRFRATDVGGETADGVLTLTVTGVNDAPEQASDADTTLAATEDGEAVTGTLGLTDVDGDDITVTVSTQPSTGTVTVTDPATGAFSYDPGSNFQSLSAGEPTTETFTLEYTDGTVTQSQLVTVTITGVNDAPVANSLGDLVVGDATDLIIDTDYLVSVISDVDGDTLTVTNVVLTDGEGSITDNEDGTFTFDPDQVASDTPFTLTYTLSDGTENVTGTISGQVVNAIPLGEAIDEDSDGISVSLSGDNIPAAFSTALGDRTVTEVALDNSSDGTLTENGGTYTFVPAEHFNGNVLLTVTLSDNSTLPGLISVNQINDPASGTPTVTGSTFVGQTLTVDTSSITDNPDGLGDFSYQWKVGAGNDIENIDGANGTTLELTEDLAGRPISVEVSFTDGDGNLESLTSGPSANVGSVSTTRADLNTASGVTVALLNNLPTGATATITNVTETFRDGLEDDEGQAITLTELFSVSNNQIVFNDAGGIGFEQSDYTVTVRVTDGANTFDLDIELDSSPLELVMGADIGESGISPRDTLEGSLVANLSTDGEGAASRVVSDNGNVTFVENLRGNTIVLTKDTSDPNETTFNSVRITETDGEALVAELSGFSLTESQIIALFQDEASEFDDEDYFYTQAALDLFSANDMNVTVEDGLNGGILSTPGNGSFVKMTGTSGNDTFFYESNFENNGENGATDIITGDGNDTILVALDGQDYIFGDLLITDFDPNSDALALYLDSSWNDLGYDLNNLVFTQINEGDQVLGTEITWDLNDDGDVSSSDVVPGRGDSQLNEEAFGSISLEGVSRADAIESIELFELPGEESVLEVTAITPTTVGAVNTLLEDDGIELEGQANDTVYGLTLTLNAGASESDLAIYGLTADLVLLDEGASLAPIVADTTTAGDDIFLVRTLRGGFEVSVTSAGEDEADFGFISLIDNNASIVDNDPDTSKSESRDIATVYFKLEDGAENTTVFIQPTITTAAGADISEQIAPISIDLV